MPLSAQQVALGPTWEYIAQQWRTDLGVVLDVRNDPSFAAASNTDVNVPITLSRTSIVSLGQQYAAKNNTSLLASPPEVAALYDQELHARDDEAFREIQEKGQRVILEKAYAIPTFEETQIYGESQKVALSFHAQENPDFLNVWKQP
ncbi:MULTISPECIES: hypothetical protein [Protofrankia]|uniref:hypothetical protein n=1 Tax=Protofrankia TaxID=2994361 RepID=UPI00097784BC|nr:MULTISPECIES: hypothetical protein [Protofrankia]ONH35447.1 hypothetical protein BL254_10820 [Protofrankia sp. BMG5.30]